MTTLESVAKVASLICHASCLFPVDKELVLCSPYLPSPASFLLSSLLLPPTFAQEGEESFIMRFSKFVAFAALGPLAYVPVASAWGAVGMFLSYFCEILALMLFV